MSNADADFIELVLAFHPKQTKKEDIESFTVGPHPDHTDSKCFYVIKKDGTKEDFSIVKCVNKIEDEHFRKKK